MEKNKQIIGFSGRICSGKTVLSKALQNEFGAEIITVAGALKELACKLSPELFPSINVLNQKKRDGNVLNMLITETHIGIISDETNVPIEHVREQCSKKKKWDDTRDMLQFIGTDIIRQYNPNWHVEKLKENIRKSNSDFICVDDIRFPNEKEAIEEMGGECYFIIRPQANNISNHPSETSLRWQDYDKAHILLNEHTEFFFRYKFIEYLKDNMKLQSEYPILLSGNEYYLQENTNFAVKNYNKTILKKVLEQNKDKYPFTENGIISFYPETVTEKFLFFYEIFGYQSHIDTCRNRFVLYNPLIFENLKFFLD